MAIENVYMDWGTMLYYEPPLGAENRIVIGEGSNGLMHFSPRAFNNSIVRVNFHFKVTAFEVNEANRFDSFYNCVRPAALAGANNISSGVSNWQGERATGLPGDIQPGSDMIYVPGYPVYIHYLWNSVPIVNLTAFQQAMSGLRQFTMYSGYPHWIEITKTEPPYFEIEYRSTPIGGIQIF